MFTDDFVWFTWNRTISGVGLRNRSVFYFRTIRDFPRIDEFHDSSAYHYRLGRPGDSSDNGTGTEITRKYRDYDVASSFNCSANNNNSAVG